METNTESTDAFTAALAAWPGGNLIGDRWRNEERHIAIMDGDADHWLPQAVVETFAVAHSNKWGSPRYVVVAPQLPIHMLIWHATEYGPHVITDTTASLGTLLDALGDQELCDLVIDVYESRDWDHDDDLLEHIALAGRSAATAGTTVALALELAAAELTDTTTNPETLVDVLRTVST